MKTKPSALISRLGQALIVATMFAAFPMVGAEAATGVATETNAEPKWSGHFSYVVGYKRMEENWNPARNQVDVGVLDFDIKRSHWPVSIAGEFLLSYVDSRPALPGFRGDNSGTYEFNLGPRKIFENSSALHQFLGAGLSVIGGSTSTAVWWDNILEDGDTSVGYYVEGGLYWHLGKKWHLGIRGEYSSASITLFGTKLDAGGIHGMLMIGARC